MRTNEYYIVRNGSLYHHGIKGQKWGQRNYQNEDGSYTAKGQAENNGHGRYSSVKNNFFNLTDKQKKYLKIGAAVVGASLLLYGGYKANRFYSDYLIKQTARHRVLKEFFLKNENSLGMQLPIWNSEIVQDKLHNSLDDLPKTEKYIDAFEHGDFKSIVKGINPKYLLDKDYRRNCYLCSTAIIMRLKGYDCSANGSKRGFSAGIIGKHIFDNIEAKFISGNDKDSFFKTILENGNDRYGYLSVQWKLFGGGHSMVYVVKDNKVHILDGQDGSIIPTSKLLKLMEIGSAYIQDVTDSIPNNNILKAIA